MLSWKKNSERLCLPGLPTNTQHSDSESSVAAASASLDKDAHGTRIGKIALRVSVAVAVSSTTGGMSFNVEGRAGHSNTHIHVSAQPEHSLWDELGGGFSENPHKKRLRDPSTFQLNRALFLWDELGVVSTTPPPKRVSQVELKSGRRESRQALVVGELAVELPCVTGDTLLGRALHWPTFQLNLSNFLWDELGLLR